MAAADYIPNLVEEVLAWQSNVGTQRIPNKYSEALGGKQSGRPLVPTEVALVNSVPGVPAQGCSVHGLRKTEPSDVLIVEETEPQLPDPEIYVWKLVPEDPPPSRSSTGQEGDKPSSATGQATGRSTTSSRLGGQKRPYCIECCSEYCVA